MKTRNMPAAKLRRQINAKNRRNGNALVVKFANRLPQDDKNYARYRMESALTPDQRVHIAEARRQRNKIYRGQDK